MSADRWGTDRDPPTSDLDIPAPRAVRDAEWAWRPRRHDGSTPPAYGRRRSGQGSTMLVVGAEDDVGRLVEQLGRTTELGWRVGGVCTPTGAGPGGAAVVADVPVLGDLDGVARLALGERFDAVCVAPAPGWTPVRLERLATDLEGSRTALLADPRLVRPTDPYVRATAVAGLPLVLLTGSALTRARRVVKGVIDRLGGLLLLVVVAPVLVICALAVRHDGGPALERRTRVGRGGQLYSLLTFRTTTPDRAAVTPVGRVLRRNGLDQLPELFNVLAGSMALVGPRPTLPGELARGDRATRRRLLVKPGLVAPGGTELSADETARTDLHYVEHWSPALDAWILLKAVRAAIGWR